MDEDEIPEKWFVCSVEILAQDKDHARALLHTNVDGLVEAMDIVEKPDD